MRALTLACNQRLTTDATLAAKLAKYPADSGNPAVFTDDRVPADAHLPYIVTSGLVANEPADTKTSIGRMPFRDIYIYGPHNSTNLVEELADRVWELFHRHRLDLTGWRTVHASAHGPVRLSSEEYDARIVSVRFRLGKVST